MLTTFENVQNQIDFIITEAIKNGGKITSEMNEELGYWMDRKDRLMRQPVSEAAKSILA